MDVLFIHPNFPGQFRGLAMAMAQEPSLRVHTLGDISWMQSNPLPAPTRGEYRLGYPAVAPAAPQIHAYAKGYESGIRRGQQVARTLVSLKHRGFEPEVIYVHPGWGDGLFLKDVYPNAKVIGLMEFYYHPRGADVGFDPEFPMAFDDIFRVRTLNALQHFALEGCDIGLCPTHWQKSRYPAPWQSHLKVLHEGVDTQVFKPNTQARITLPDGCTLHAGDEVLTYASRTLEPYRGFHSFMRALPAILAQRPLCHVVVMGDEAGPGYGPAPKDSASWKQKLLDEVGPQMDLQRVHFVGTLPLDQFIQVLQVSRVHVYLTYPFVLSWSALEAMSCGCLLLASDTEPVQEVIQHGRNGLLCPFFAPDQLAHQAVDALSDSKKYNVLREQARADIQGTFDFHQVVYPQHKGLLRVHHQSLI